MSLFRCNNSPISTLRVGLIQALGLTTNHRRFVLDITTVALGVVAVGLALFFLQRSLHPDLAAGKLKAMMDMWGDTRGLWIYRVAYVGIPFFFGATLILAGINGLSLSGLF